MIRDVNIIPIESVFSGAVRPHVRGLEIMYPNDTVKYQREFLNNGLIVNPLQSLVIDDHFYSYRQKMTDPSIDTYFLCIL